MPSKANHTAANALEPRSPLDLQTQVEEYQASEVQRLCEAHTPDAVRVLLSIATNQPYLADRGKDGRFEIDPEGTETAYAPGPRVTAAKYIIEQAHGRPTQRVVHNGDRGSGGLTVVIHQMSSGEIKTIGVSTDHPELGEGENRPAA